MAVHDIGAAVDLVDLRLVGDDPDLVEHVDGDVFRAEFFLNLLLNPAPERTAGLAFRIHHRSGDLLEHVILRQEIPAHFRVTEPLGDDVRPVVGREVDPQLFFRHRQRGEKIFNELLRFFLQRLTL